MNISTRFNINDNVYCIVKNSIIKCKISAIEINVRDDEMQVRYTVFDNKNKDYLFVDEENLFANKQELINYIEKIK